MFKKWHIAGLIFGILLICLFFIQGFIGRKTDKETQVPVCPEEPPRVLAEQQDQQEPEQPDTEEDVYEEAVPASEYAAPDLSDEKKKEPSVQQLIEDLKDDDIPCNATIAKRELASRLPDDKEAVDALIKALNSGDRQQRQIAAYILARWATQMDLSSNRQFLKVMVEALRDDEVFSNCKTAVSFLFEHPSDTAGFLQDALMSDDRQQRDFAAFILAISMDVPPESRTRVLEILGDFSCSYWGCLPWEYRYGAWALCAAEAQEKENHQNYSEGIFPDQTYSMQEGETLRDIAWRYRTESYFLLMYNNLRSEDEIKPGMTIYIPAALSQHPAEAAYTESPVYEHVLYPGETLEDVARQYGADTNVIMELNGITNPASVKPE